MRETGTGQQVAQLHERLVMMMMMMMMNKTINNLIGKGAGRALSLRVIPWHLPYN